MEEISPISTDVPSIDRLVHAWQGRFTMGLSPAALTLAYFDWLLHLGNSPGKQTELLENAWRKGMGFWLYALHATVEPDTPAFIKPLPQDKRFASPEWQRWPFNLMYQSFLMAEQWWHYATTNVQGVSHHHEDVVSFAARQLLDVFAPSNFPWTNPEVLRTTAEQSGTNLLRGAEHFWEDWEQTITEKKPESTAAFAVGKTVAITPGNVIYRNRLIELIQYTPTTETVYAEPVLIVPAWIMKYYILDLSPKNSLIKYLVDQGHTVFTISWRNPSSEDRDLGMEDYRTRGVMAALDAITAVMPGRKVHTVGYCLGGTLLAIVAAAMARDGDERLQSVTLFAAQTDFTEAGELTLFIDESQVSYLQDMMWEQGYLESTRMSGAFQMLRSNDLVWSRMINEYLLGKEPFMNDLMAWNADATRMPYRMHSEYLNSLFLRNDLAMGRYEVGGGPIALTDIRVPIFTVATVQDHVAPWHSVYKLHLLTDTELTFLLTSGGHNAGIVSEPGHPRRYYQMATQKDGDKYIPPNLWKVTMPVQEGSWWIAWEDWLAERSTGPVTPPPLGAPEQGYVPLYAAPGIYVLQQ